LGAVPAPPNLGNAKSEYNVPVKKVSDKVGVVRGSEFSSVFD